MSLFDNSLYKYSGMLHPAPPLMFTHDVQHPLPQRLLPSAPPSLSASFPQRLLPSAPAANALSKPVPITGVV